MTLNLTVITPGYITQASDRRMVALPTGSIVDDEANKGVVLQTEDGIFTITFAGVGAFPANRTLTRMDMWLAERLADEGGPELPVAETVELIRILATDLFGNFPSDSDVRHSFVIAGWVNEAPKTGRAVAWMITNHGDTRGRAFVAPAREFNSYPLTHGDKRTHLYGFGLIGSVARAERRRIEALMRKGSTVDRMEQVVVDVIRGAAGKPDWSWGINKNVLAVSLSPTGQARSTFYPDSSIRQNYAPLFVWHQKGANLLAGDVDSLPSSGMNFRFGECLMVGVPGGEQNRSTLTARDVEQIGFLTRLSNAKFKTDSNEGDQITVVEAIPVN